MNNKNLSALDLALQELRDLVRRIHNDVASTSQDEAVKLFRKGVRMRMFQDAEYGSLVLFAELGDEYFDCVIDLNKAANRKTERISLGAVESGVQLAILKSLDSLKKQPELEFAERLDAALAELRNALCEQAIPWSVHLEVAGLDASGLPRTVGGTEFYLVDRVRLSHFLGHLANIVDTMRNTDEEKEAAKKDVSDQMSQGLLGKTYAHVRISATDVNAARALALKRLRQTLDVVNFFATILGHSGARVYLPWDAKPYLARSFTIADNLQEGNWRSSWEGPSVPFSLSQLEGQRSDASGFSRASTILEKNNANPIENRVLSALQWAGRASIEERKEEALLLFIVALESLLLDNAENQQLRYRFAVRGAHLLGGNLKSKTEICGALKHLYDLRSAVVHSGSTDISDSDRDTARHFAGRAIFRVLATEPFSTMTTEEEFAGWFEDQVLGPDNPTKSSP